MSKSKPGKATPLAEFADKYLSPADHVATVLADKDAEVTALEVERDAAKLQAFRLQTAMQVQQAENALKEARDRALATTTLRKRLAAELAERYAVDWQTHAIEPQTGQLVEVAKE